MGRHLGCYGEKVATPNFDRIAGRGVRFSNYFCTSPSCSPSRGSISTGLYPHNNGLVGLAHLGWSIKKNVKTMPIYFNKLGYNTHLIGGHHEMPVENQNKYESRKAAADALGYKHFHDTADLVPDPHYNYIGACYEILKKQIDNISSENPFFINIGTPGAHRAYAAVRAGIIFNPDHPDHVSVPPYLPDRQAVREDISFLNGFVKREDEYTGKIFDLLEEKGLLENTLFVCTTDHGIAMPRAKGMLYDPGVGTYLIMYWKGRFEGGRVFNELLSNVDLLPTYLELAGGRVPELDGKSILPLLDGKNYMENEYIFTELTWHDQYNPMRSIRTRTGKLIRNFGNRPRVYLPLDIYMGRAGESMYADCYYYRRPEYELYDLENDFTEVNNLYNLPEHSELQNSLAGKLENWMRKTEDPLLFGDIPPNPVQKIRLESRYNNG